MKRMTVGKLKTSFSDVLREVEKGTVVAVEFGRKHTPVAVLLPYAQYAEKKAPRRLGVLEGRARYRVRESFAMSDDDLLSS